MPILKKKLENLLDPIKNGAFNVCQSYKGAFNENFC